MNEAEAPVVDRYFATPNYLRVMKIPLQRGRFFSDLDGPRTPPVAVISESCARLQFPGEDPSAGAFASSARTLTLAP